MMTIRTIAFIFCIIAATATLASAQQKGNLRASSSSLPSDNGTRGLAAVADALSNSKDRKWANGLIAARNSNNGPTAKSCSPPATRIKASSTGTLYNTSRQNHVVLKVGSNTISVIAPNSSANFEIAMDCVMLQVWDGKTGVMVGSFYGSTAGSITAIQGTKFVLSNTPNKGDLTANTNGLWM